MGFADRDRLSSFRLGPVVEGGFDLPQRQEHRPGHGRRLGGGP